MTVTACTIQLAVRPPGTLVPANFRMVSAVIADPGRGEVHLKMLWPSLDPYRLGRMTVGPS
jgi:NADPH-dependent curcumin reductase CurA